MNRTVNAAVAATIMIVSGAATLSAADAQAARLTENAPAVMTAAIELTTHTVVVSGAKPGAQVLLVGWMRYLDEFNQDSGAKFEETQIADAAGRASFAPKHLSRTSGWLAADLSNGTYAVAYPPGYLAPARKQAAISLSRGADALLIDMPQAAVWCIRPGVGVWSIRAGRRGANDSNPHGNEGVRIQTARFASLTASPAAPQHLGLGDVVFVIDPIRLEILVVQLDAKTIAEAQRDR